MKTKSLVILSVSVLVLAFLTLGCTSVDNALNSPTAVPTITQSIPDTQGISPTDTPTDVPAITTGDNSTDVPDITPTDNSTGDSSITPTNNSTDLPYISPTDVPTDIPANDTNGTPDTSGDNQSLPYGDTPTPDAGSY